MNRIILIGRLTKDPESKYTSNGVAVAQFRIAVDRPFRNQETGDKETDFIDIVAWRRTAEFIAQYIAKGRLVAIEGRLQMRSWVAQDGSKRVAYEVVADSVQCLDRAPDGQAPAQGAQAGAAPAQKPQIPADVQDDDYDPFEDE